MYPDQTAQGAVWSGSKLFSLIFICLIMFAKNLQQMTLADSSFRWFFAGALRVNLHVSFMRPIQATTNALLVWFIINRFSSNFAEALLTGRSGLCNVLHILRFSSLMGKAQIPYSTQYVLFYLICSITNFFWNLIKPAEQGSSRVFFQFHESLLTLSLIAGIFVICL